MNFKIFRFQPILDLQGIFFNFYDKFIFVNCYNSVKFYFELNLLFPGDKICFKLWEYIIYIFLTCLVIA